MNAEDVRGDREPRRTDPPGLAAASSRTTQARFLDHELRNMLAVIGSALNLMERHADDRDQVEALMIAARSKLDQAPALISELHALVLLDRVSPSERVPAVGPSTAWRDLNQAPADPEKIVCTGGALKPGVLEAAPAR